MIPNIVKNIHERSVKSRYPNIQEDIISFFKIFANDISFVNFLKFDMEKIKCLVGKIAISTKKQLLVLSPF
jgi:hypothetical protein